MSDDNNISESENTYLDWLTELQESLVRKHDLAKNREPIVYEFTNDPALLHQYYRLREIMYRRMFKTDKFVGTEDVYDKISHILIARQGKLCIGGARLTIREPYEEFLLPMETEQFKLKEKLPQLGLEYGRHGEASRFAIMEGYNEREVMYNLSKLLCEKGLQQDLRYVFAKSTYPMARNWRMIGNRILNIDTQILDVEVPENPIHPEVQWYIAMFDTKIGKEEMDAAMQVKKQIAELDTETILH